MHDNMVGNIPVPIQFTISIEIKEKRYRVLFEGITMGASKMGISGLYKQERETMNNHIRPKLKSIALSLNDFINKSGIVEDW